MTSPWARVGLAWALSWAGAVLFWGCGAKPKAPVLRTSAVYQNSREGVRFLVPNGWRQTASANLPTGKLAKPARLVLYERPGSSLELMCSDAADTGDLAKFFGQPSLGAKSWTTQAEPLAVRINDVEATRNIFQGQVLGKQMTKDVFSFPQGERIYSFVALYPSDDEKTGQEIRRAVESVIWE